MADCCKGPDPKEALLADAEAETSKKEPEVTLPKIMLILSITLILGLETINLSQCFSFLPDYFIERGLDQTWVGITSAVQFACVFVTTVLGAKLAQRPGWGVSKMLPMAVCGQLVTQVVWGLVGAQLYGVSLGVFHIFIRGMCGLFDGFVQMAGPAMVLRVLPESQIAAAMGFVETLRAIGSLVAPIFGTQLYTIGGGQTFWAPFVAVAGIEGVALLIFLFALSCVPPGTTDQKTPAVAAMALLSKPPTISLMLMFALACFPIAAIEPAIEPYLTSPPFNCTVQQVGLFFLLMGVTDLVTASLGVGIVSIVGHLPALFLSCALQILGCILLATTAQNFWVVWGSFAPVSLGLMPVFIASSALLMRICRTYDLDPKAYSEFISAAVMGTMTLAMGVFGLIAGVTVQAIGFRHFNFVGAGIVALQIPLVCIGFSRWAMGRPLAIPIEQTEEHKAEVAKQKEEEAKKKAEKAEAAAQAKAA